MRFLVTSGAERLLTSAGQYHGVDRLLLIRLLESMDQLFDCLKAESVQHLGPVDRDSDGVSAELVQNVLVGGHRYLRGRKGQAQPCMVRPPETLIV